MMEFMTTGYTLEDRIYDNMDPNDALALLKLDEQSEACRFYSNVRRCRECSFQREEGVSCTGGELALRLCGIREENK